MFGTRRDFLTASSAIAAALGLRAVGADPISTDDGGPAVIWLQFHKHAIDRYQILTPTTWNASPRDDVGEPGPIEQALVGTPVRRRDQPVELLRVVHSFDPCLACSVH